MAYETIDAPVNCNFQLNFAHLSFAELNKYYLKRLIFIENSFYYILFEELGILFSVSPVFSLS